MSHNGWERAEITIPRPEMAGLHKTLRDAVNGHHEAVRTHATALHKEIGQGTRSVKLYFERLEAYKRKQWQDASKAPGITSWSYRAPSAAAIASAIAKDVALDVIENMLHTAKRDPEKGIHQPTVTEVTKLAPKVTNRTAEFQVTGEGGSVDAYISFKGNVITWDVPENNHAVDRAHEAPLGVAFFAALGKIKWTRTSGGYGTGNDEYRRESKEHGGGSNYITFAYGPIGEAAQLEQSAQNMGMTVAAYKKMMSQAPKTMRSSVGRW